MVCSMCGGSMVPAATRCDQCQIEEARQRMLSKGKTFEVTAVSDHGAVGLKDAVTGTAYVAEDCWLEYPERWVGKTLEYVEGVCLSDRWSCTCSEFRSEEGKP